MSDRISIPELRAAAEKRDHNDEPGGHVCMTGDYALALLGAVEAAREVAQYENFDFEYAEDVEFKEHSAAFDALREALARFSFENTVR